MATPPPPPTSPPPPANNAAPNPWGATEKAAPKPRKSEDRFPCTDCGADMRFAPGAAQLVCDHCGATQPAPVVEKRDRAALTEHDFNDAIAALKSGKDPKGFDKDEFDETAGVPCTNCGARVPFEGDAHAGECPFCATPVVGDPGLIRQIRPHGVVGFVLDEPTAHAAMNKWLGRLWFAPNGLKEYAKKGRKLNGIYVPYWTFDADTKTRYTGQRGDDYTETRTVMRDGKSVQESVTKTRWRPVSGRVARWFDDVTVLASNSLPRSHTDALEPWDFTALQPYQPHFLAGFRAEAYGVDLPDGYVMGREKMDIVIRNDIHRDIGGDHQRISNMDVAIKDITFKHVLLPVWMAAYSFRGKTYRFVVNGQSGKVKGERPWSFWKITFAVLAAAVVIGGIIFLANQGQ